MEDGRTKKDKSKKNNPELGSAEGSSLRVVGRQDSDQADHNEDAYNQSVLRAAEKLYGEKIACPDSAVSAIATHSKRSNIQFLDILSMEDSLEKILADGHGARAAISLAIEMNENLLLLDQHQGFARSLITHLANLYAWKYQVLRAGPTDTEDAENVLLDELMLYSTKLDNLEERRLIVIEGLSVAGKRFSSAFRKMIISRTINGRPVPANISFVVIESGIQTGIVENCSEFIEQSFCIYLDEENLRQQDAFYYYMDRRRELNIKLDAANDTGDDAIIAKIQRLIKKETPIRLAPTEPGDGTLQVFMDNVIASVPDANLARKQQILLDILEPELSSQRMEIAEIMLGGLIGATAASDCLGKYIKDITIAENLPGSSLNSYFLDEVYSATSLTELCRNNRIYYIYAVKEFMRNAEELHYLGRKNKLVANKIAAFVEFIYETDKECFYALHKTLPFIFNDEFSL